MKTEYIAIIMMIIVALGLLYYGYTTFIKNKDLMLLSRNLTIINKD